jgi:type II secretion system protein G
VAISLFHPSLKRGFTLVELLVVIAIIGILAMGIISIVDPKAQLQKAQDARRKTDLSQIQKAFETFYQDNGRYPDVVSYKIKSTKGDGSAAEWGTDQWAPYMGTLPKDPSSSKNYVYYASVDRQTYYIYASLDRGTSDSRACFASGNPCASAVTNGIPTACGGNCNYGVSSPNVSP